MSDSRVPAWIAAPIATAREVVGNNRKVVYLGLVIFTGLYYTGRLPSVGVPSWWPAAAIAAAAAYFGGRAAARRILDLVPEPDGILLVEFRADEPGGAIYELSEEAFEDMWVFAGELYQWDTSPRRVYEVREYDPEKNVAVGNWRESLPGSEIAAEKTPEDAMSKVRELRKTFEADAAEARELRRRFRGIARELDKGRAEAQQQILDDHVAPDLGGSRSIDDVIDETLPDSLHPEQASDGEVSPDDLLEQADADDTPEDADDRLEQTPLLNDGGRNE